MAPASNGMAPLVFRRSILKSILFTLLLTIPLIFLLHALAEDVWLKKYYARIESDDAVMRAKNIAMIAKTAVESLPSGGGCAAYYPIDSRAAGD